MTTVESFELARERQKKRRKGGSQMRRQEVKIRALFDLVQKDYIDNRKKSKATLDVHIDNHLAPFFADRSAERLRPHDIQEYKDKRRAEGAQNSTVNLELAALRRAYSLGVEAELVVNRPVIKLYSVGKSNRRTGFFEEEDYIKQLVSLPPYAKQILRFGYHSGWREGEIFKLTWSDNYDEAGQVIRIYDSKSSEGRVLPLRDQDGELTELGQVIEEQKSRRVGACPFIFHFQGRPAHRTTFNKHWRKACKASGVKRYFHDLRRTAVRNLTRAGVHRTIAKMVTGHETDDVFERYDIVDTRDIQEAFAKMSHYLTARKNGGNGEGNATNDNGTESEPNSGREHQPKKTADLAERAGFEPACAVETQHDFQSHSLSKMLKVFTKMFTFWKQS